MKPLDRRFRLLFSLAAFLAVVSCSGCSNDAAGPDPSEPVELATLDWNEIALDMVEKHKPSQQAALRGMAYLTLAQFEAVDAAWKQVGQIPTRAAGAVAGASAVVLNHLHPADAGTFEAEVRARESALPTDQRQAFLAGEALGRAAGSKAVSRAQGDRFNTQWTGVVPTGPGVWFSSAVPAAAPVLPLLGQMQPFFMESGNQFRPAPPPAPGSPAFEEALAEVRGIAATRTPQQDSIAKFWAMGTGKLIAGFWNTTAAGLIQRGRLDERQSAHALALMNGAAMDALISCADAKFTYWLLRPSQADATVTLAIGLPNFPAYPSNHACFSGAAAYLLGALFPEERDGLAQMAYDAGLSRVYGGIHYRFDSDAGLEIARDVAGLALQADKGGKLLALLR